MAALIHQKRIGFESSLGSLISPALQFKLERDDNRLEIKYLNWQSFIAVKLAILLHVQEANCI